MMVPDRSVRVMLVAATVFLVGCAKESSNPGLPQLGTYPAQVGDSWTYDRTAGLSNFRPMDSTVTYTPDTIRSAIAVRVTRLLKLASLSGGDSIPVAEFEKKEQSLGLQPRSFTGYEYFESTPQAFLLHGYISAGVLVGPVAPSRAVSYALGGRTFTSLEELTAFITAPPQAGRADSLVRENPPARVLQFPLESGTTWTFRVQPWRIDKQVTGETSLSANGKLYRCSEIRWYYDMNRDGVWDDDITILDYIAPEGSIMRSLQIRNILVSTETHPDGIGTADMKDEYVLTSVHLY